MKKEIAIKLRIAAEKASEVFSDPQRPLNTNKETFSVDKVTPLSESTAAVTFCKDARKFALAFFYYLNTSGGQWRYFFPSDSHLLGMGMMSQAKQCIEVANIGFNWRE